MQGIVASEVVQYGTLHRLAGLDTKATTENAWMPVEFAINAINPKTVSSLLLLGALPLVLAGLVIFLMSGGKEQKVGLYCVLGLAAAITVLGAWQLSSVRIVMDPRTLSVGGGLYRVSLPIADVDRESTRLRTAARGGHALGMRTNGIGMPGLSLGWHTSGGGKVFAAITDPEKVVVIPTTAGFTVLASPDDPDAFLEALKAR
jgi:hypothetical protein